ncbi:MAG: hypothetical protein PHW02_02520, partial [bacterium]|nr:hypothetical protein [bacterium]
LKTEEIKTRTIMEERRREFEELNEKVERIETDFPNIREYKPLQDDAPQVIEAKMGLNQLLKIKMKLDEIIVLRKNQERKLAAVLGIEKIENIKKNIENELSDKEKTLLTYRKELGTVTEELKAKNTELARIGTKRQEMQQSFVDDQVKLENLKKELSETTQKMVKIAKIEKQMQEQYNTLQIELKKFNDEKDSISSRVNAEKMHLEELENKKKEIEAEVNNLQNELEKRKKAINSESESLTGDISRKRASAEEEMASFELQMKKKREEAEAELENLKQIQAKMREQNASLENAADRKELEKLTEEIKGLRENLLKNHNQVVKANQENEQLRKKIAEMETHSETYTGNKETNEEERARIKNLEDTVSRLSLENRNLKEIIERAKTEKHFVSEDFAKKTKEETKEERRVDIFEALSKSPQPEKNFESERTPKKETFEERQLSDYEKEFRKMEDESTKESSSNDDILFG